MDLTQLANLGEFIGGVAVLVTLIYLAAQVRQSTRAQEQANELAKADAVHKSTTAFSNFRQLLADEGANAIWLKARSGEILSLEEEQRVFYVLEELTYSALTAMACQEAAGAEETAKAIPEVVVRYMRGSETLHRIWSPLATDLADFGFVDFAAAITSRLRAEGATQ